MPGRRTALLGGGTGQVQNELTGLDGIARSELETGGLKVVTTISRPLEVELYQAVNENLTVNEQATMLSAIADAGRYRQAHIVRYWRHGAGGAEQPAKFAAHQALPPNLDADVQYALEDATAKSAAVIFGQRDPGAFIGVPGTTLVDRGVAAAPEGQRRGALAGRRDVPDPPAMSFPGG